MNRNFRSPIQPAARGKVWWTGFSALALLAAVPAFAQLPPLTKVDASSSINANGSWINLAGNAGWHQTELIRATATANRTSNVITSFNITNQGGGYVTAPNVVISGGNGTGATAVAVVSGGRVVAINVVNGGTGYTAAPTVTIDIPAPGGVGSSIRFNNDITDNRTITLDGNRTVGQMILGELSGGSIYTISSGTGGTLTFDNGAAGGGAYLNKFQGGNDVISAPVSIADQLNVRITTARLSLTNSVLGLGTLTSYGNGTLALTGNNTASNVNLWLWNRGTTNTGAQVELGAATGNAVGGDIRIGSATLGTSGHAVLQLLLGRANTDQIKDSATLIFDSFAGSGRNNYFKLMGGNETVGRILDLGSLAVIENREGEGVGTAATLTIAGNADSEVTGFIRDNSGNNLQQADANGTVGANRLGLTKNGTGTLLLSGGNMIYTGNTTVSNGTLHLRQTTNFRSNITNSAKTVMEVTSGTWNFLKTFNDPDGTGPTLAPATQYLTVTGSGSLTKSGAGVLNMYSGQQVGGALTVENGTLNLSGSGGGNTLSGGIVMAGDMGLNRNLGLFGATTVTGGINATGRYGLAGSAITIRGALIGFSDQQASTFTDGIANVSGPIKVNYMDLRLESGASVTKVTGGGTSGSANVTVTNSSSLVVGMRVSGTGVPANTTISAIDPVTRVVTLSSNASIPGGTTLTFERHTHTDGVLTGSPTSLTVIGKPNAVGATASSGRLILSNTQFSNNANRIPDATPILSKGAVIEFANDGSNTAFIETLGAVTLSQGQSQIVGYQAGTSGSSTLTLTSLTRSRGATVEFGGRFESGGTVSTVTGALGTTTRNRILINGAVPNDDGILGGWAFADFDFVKYGANGVTPLVAGDYKVAAQSNGSDMNAIDNVKIDGVNPSLASRRAINSLNFRPNTGAAAANRTVTLNSFPLSIESGGLLSSHGDHTINGTGQSGYVTVGSAFNTPAELFTIVGTTFNTPTGNRSLNIQASIQDFNLQYTAGVTMPANSNVITIGATGGVAAYRVGMKVTHPSFPDGTVITAIDPGNNTITVNHTNGGAALTVNGSNPLRVLGGSVGLTKSGPGLLQLALTNVNTYSGPTSVNNGTLRLLRDTNLGTAPASFVADQLRLDGGTLQLGISGNDLADRIFNFTEATRGWTIGESGGRLELGHTNPNGVNMAKVLSTITSPIYAEGVFELAVRGNVAADVFNNLTLGGAASTNYYGGGLKTEGSYEGIITVNGNNTVGGLLMEGSRVTFTGNNNFTGPLRVLSGQLTLNAANTYKGTGSFSDPILLGAATLTFGHAQALGTGPLDLTLGTAVSDAASVRLFGTNQTVRRLSGTALSTISNGAGSGTNSTLTVDIDSNQTFAGALDNAGGTLHLTKTGPGRLALTNVDSNFSGVVRIEEGVIDVQTVTFTGGNSSLGTGSVGGTGLADDASFIVLDGGALSFSPRGQQFTDRSFTLGTGTNAGALVANGLNQAARVIIGADFIYKTILGQERVVSAPVAFTGAGARTLTLSGVNSGDNEFMLDLGDKSGSEPTSLLKTGPGTWVLGQPGSFSGQVTQQEGVLAIQGNNALGTSGIATTVSTTNDTLTGSLPNGTEVSFPNFVNTTLPFGLSPNNRYYVINSTGTTFQLATTRGGTTAVNLSGDSANVMYVPNINPVASTVADHTTNTFTGNLANGMTVAFGVRTRERIQGTTSVTNGSLPGGINNYETYYVVNATGTTFQVAATPGGAAQDITTNGALLYYRSSVLGNPDAGTVLLGGRFDLRNVDYFTPETLTFQGGSLGLPNNTQATWTGNIDIQANTNITLGINSTLTVNGNWLGTRAINQLGEGTLIMRGEDISPALLVSPNGPTGSYDQEMENFRRTYTLQAGTLVLDYSANNNSKLVDVATLVMGGGRRGGVLRLQNGSHEEVVNALSLQAGANQIFRDSGSSTIRLNNISRNVGSSLYFDLARIASVDNPNYNNILGGWAIIRDALVQASWIIPGTVSRTFTANEVNDSFLVPLAQQFHYLSNATPVRVTTTGTLPQGLQAGVTYYAINNGTRSFRLSATPNGPPLDITTPGTGTHTVATFGAVKRAGFATLTFTAHAERYPGASGNNRIQVRIVNTGGPGAISSTRTGTATPQDPLVYTVLTTSTVSSTTAVANFVNTDPNAIDYLTASTSGSSTTADLGTYGDPTFLSGGTDDNGNQELDWARNGTTTPGNFQDGLVLPSSNYVSNVFNENANTNITDSFSRADGGIAYTLRFATRAPTNVELRAGATPETSLGHVLQTGAILVSPSVGANDSVISGAGSLTTENQGNLQNFLIHQYNQSGDLVIGVPMKDRGVIVRKGRLTSAENNVITSLPSTSSLAVGAAVSGGGVAANSVIASIPDEHTVILDRALTALDGGRAEFTFTVGGIPVRLFGTRNNTDQRRINGVFIPASPPERPTSTLTASDLYIGMPVSGPGIPPGATITGFYNEFDIQINTNHFFTGATPELTFTPSVGLEKLGGGTLVLNGANSFTGVTFIADGVLRAQSLTDGGVAGSLGASRPDVGNLNLNGGTLQYVGETSSSNRGFTLTDLAVFSIGHERTLAALSGSVSGSDRLAKTGSGTLEMRGNAALQEMEVSEGRLLLNSIDLNATPGTFSPSNFGQTGVMALRMSGGVLEVRGAEEGNVGQTFGGALFVDEGASEIRSVSVLGYDPNNLTLGRVARLTNLTLMGNEETASVQRSSGGTVRFVEAPEAGAGAANIFLNTSTFERALVLPWAVYQDVTNIVRPGVNDFASVSLLNGAVVSADSQSLYDLGSFFMDANNWGTAEPGSSIDASEGGRVEVDLENGVNATSGSDILTVSAGLADVLDNVLVGMSVFGPGIPSDTQVTEVRTDTLEIVLNKAATANAEGASYLFTKERTFYGTLAADREVNTIRYFSTAESAINVPDNVTLRLLSGAILVGANVRGGSKGIYGDGDLMAVAAAGDGSDLIVHNYNPVMPFTLDANVVDNLIRLEVTSGTTTSGGGSVVSGSDELDVSLSYSFLALRRIHAGMAVEGPGIAPDTYVAAVEVSFRKITLTRPATATFNNQVYLFRSSTSLVQAGTGTTILSGDNLYTGRTFAHGGVLRIDSAGAVPGGLTSAAPLATSSHIVIEGGVLGLASGNFSRSLGSADNQVEFKGSGGFAAYGADRTVNFGGLAEPARLRYGNDGFTPDGSSFVLGAQDATHKVTLLNPLDLGSFSQALRVDNGPAAIEGELAGALSGTGRLIKFGLGSLRLSASSTHTGGIEIAQGRLVAANQTNVFGTGAGAVMLGTSRTNTPRNAGVELELEGGSHAKTLQVGNVNAPGSEWVSRGTTDAAAATLGTYASTATVNGHPAIAYYDASNGDLKYVRAADPRGSSWLAPVTVASRGDVGLHPSLAVINGNPAISYYDATNRTLVYIRSTDVSGVFWGAPVIADASDVSAVALQSDGKIVFGGNFLNFDGASRTRLGRLSSTGILDAGFTATANGQVLAIVVQSDDKIVIGGSFTEVNGVARNRIARLNADGTLDAGFNPNADNLVRTLVLDASSRLLVGGAFTNIGGAGRGRIARLQANGTADSFNPNANGEVFAIAVQADNSVLLGGSFTQVTGSDRFRMARVGETGNLETFHPNLNSDVRAIAVMNDGKILIGGTFTTLAGGGRSRSRLARITSAGVNDDTYPIDAGSTVTGIRKLADGSFIVLGTFTNIGTTAVSRIAHLNSDGTLDAAFNPDPDYEVRSVVQQADQKLVVGGLFSNLGGTSQHWVARLNLDGTGDGGFSRQADDKGRYSSLVFVAGAPAIAYYDANKTDLRYVRSTDANGAAWGTPVEVVASANDVGRAISMEMLNIGGDLITKNTSNNTVTITGVATLGTPSIAFYDATAGDLKYVVANNAAGSDWSAAVTIASAGDVGSHLSLELVNGFPAVAYHDAGSGDLYYARATNAAGLINYLRNNEGAVQTIPIASLVFDPAWGTPTLLDAGGTAGQYPSLTVLPGVVATPAVAYYEAVGGDLRFVRASDTDGAAWGAPQTLQSAGDVGRNAGLIVVDGVAGVSYQDAGAGNLKFMHLADAAGYSRIAFSADTTWSGTIQLDGTAMFAPGAGLTATLTGALNGVAGFKLAGEGTLRLDNAANSFGSGLNGAGAAVNAPVVIRSGTLLLGAASALGNTVVELGDATPQILTVERATTFGSLTRLSGRFDADHNGDFDNAGGPGAFVEVDRTIDGFSYSEADAGTLILVKDEDNPAWNGVYRIVFIVGQLDGTMNLARVAEMDTVAEMAYGTQVRVTEGTHAGKAFFLASHVSELNVSALLWVQDVADGTLALRANAAGMNITNAIDVNAGNGSGAAILGAASGVTSGQVEFSGAVVLQNQRAGVRELRTVSLDSAITGGFGVNFTGVFSEANGGFGGTADALTLRKIGSGVATLRGASTHHGGVVVAEGTLLVMNTTGSATGVGTVTVNAGAVLGGTGIIGGAVSLGGTGLNPAILRPGDPTVSSALTETLTISGALTVGADSVVEFTAGTANLTRLVANTVSITPTGRLLLQFAGGYTPGIGAEFDLIDGTISFTGGTPANLLTNLKLPGAYTWDTSSFISDGIVRITGATTPVAVTSNPVAQTVNPGVTVNFTVQVSGSPNFTYQWQRDTGSGWVNVGPETNAALTSNTLSLVGVAEADQGSYRATVTNGDGTYLATSAEVALIVNDPPVIVQQPVSVTVDPNANATFTVVASGPAPISYQWRRGTTNLANGAKYSGVNAATLTVLNAQQADEASDFNVVVSNLAGSAPASAVVSLTVRDPVTIVTPPASITVSSLDPANFSVVAGGTGPFTYQWERDSGAGFQPIAGATDQSLRIDGVTLEDDGDQVRVTVSNGFSNLTSAAATLSVVDGFPSILQQPVSQTVLAGSTLTLTSEVGGASAGRSIQWQLNGKPVRLGAVTSGGITSNASVTETQVGQVVTTTLTVTNVSSAYAGDFTCVASNLNGVSPSQKGQVVVVSNPQVVLPVQDGKKAVMTVVASGPKDQLALVTYKWQKDGADIDPDVGRISPDNTKTLTFTTANPADSATYTCLVTGPGPAPSNRQTVSGGTHELKVFTAAPELLAITFPDAMVGADFDYQIPVNLDSAMAPSKYAAKGLPAGLKLDAKTGRITGRPTKSGLFQVTVTVSNSFGTDTPDSGVTPLSVQAVPSGAVGVFAGRLPRHAALNSNLGGRFDMTVASSGSFSGKLNLGGVSYAFKGALVLDPDLDTPALPTGSVVILRKGKPVAPPPLQVNFTINPATNRISAASVTAGTDSFNFTGYRNRYSLLAPADGYTGYHTLALQPTGLDDEDLSVPHGDGYASFTVAPAGTLSVVGKTADGQAVTGATFIGPSGEILVFQVLYKAAPKGSLLGQLNLSRGVNLEDPQDNVITSTALTWTCPENLDPKNRLYRAGFGPLDITAVGGFYALPVDPVLILGLANGVDNAKLSFSLDGLEVINAASNPSIPGAGVISGGALDVITGNKILVPATTALTKISVVAKSGAFKGTFTLADNVPSVGIVTRKVSYQGLIVRSGGDLIGAGYFLAPGRTPDIKTSPILSNQVLFEKNP